ncbi:MAG: hypothetical protein RLZZ262_2321 [Bacteroidota bacterium]|jgi:hypothetical protein
MNNSKYIAFGFIALVVIVLVVALAWPSSVNWKESYTKDKLQPYDTYIFHELIKESGLTKEMVEVMDSLHLTLSKSDQGFGSYIFIGNSFNGNADDINALLKYVEEGHPAFIIADNPGNLLYEVCDLEESDEWHETSDGSYQLAEQYWWNSAADTMVVAYHKDVNNVEYTYNLRYYYDYEVERFDWTYFNRTLRAEGNKEVRVVGGFDGDYVNGIEVPYGRGKFYFHSTPIAFTNYHLKEKNGMKYCRAFMSYMQAGKIYWDIENQRMDFTSQHDESGTESEARKGPLEYILSQPALSKAWYLALILLLLYLIFAGRRRQRAIPTIKAPSNTSIEFTEVVSQLFLKQKDHRKLVDMKMEMWRSHARERYKIRWQEKHVHLEVSVLEIWSMRSGVPLDILTRIIETYNGLDKFNEVQTEEMLQLHSLMETYYHNCK